MTLFGSRGAWLGAAFLLLLVGALSLGLRFVRQGRVAASTLEHRLEVVGCNQHTHIASRSFRLVGRSHVLDAFAAGRVPGTQLDGLGWGRYSLRRRLDPPREGALAGTGAGHPIDRANPPTELDATLFEIKARSDLPRPGQLRCFDQAGRTCDAQVVQLLSRRALSHAVHEARLGRTSDVMEWLSVSESLTPPLCEDSRFSPGRCLEEAMLQTEVRVRLGSPQAGAPMLTSASYRCAVVEYIFRSIDGAAGGRGAWRHVLGSLARLEFWRVRSMSESTLALPGLAELLGALVDGPCAVSEARVEASQHLPPRVRTRWLTSYGPTIRQLMELEAWWEIADLVEQARRCAAGEDPVSCRDIPTELSCLGNRVDFSVTQDAVSILIWQESSAGARWLDAPLRWSFARHVAAP